MARPSLVGALDLGAAAVAAALLLVVTLGLTGPARVLAALLFVTFVPGWALIGHVRVVEAGVATVALAAALSLTVCTAATVAMVWLEAWSPIALFDILAGSSLTVLAARLAFGRGGPSRILSAQVTACDNPDRLLHPTADDAVVGPVASRPSLQRRYTVRPEDLKLTHVSVQVGFAPHARFDGNDLADFYSQVHRRHQFETFRRDGSIAFVMETEGVKRLETNRDLARYSETAPSDFGILKSNCIDVLAQLQRRFDLTVLTDPSVHLGVVWNPVGARVPFAQVVRGLLDLDSRPSLPNGTSTTQVGLHLTGSHGQPPRHDWQLSVDPSDQDSHSMILHLAADYKSGIDDPGSISDYLQRGRDFLFGDAVCFLASFLESDHAPSTPSDPVTAEPTTNGARGTVSLIREEP